jgi:hypothetical protein
MAALPDDLAELKQRLRASWMAGDFTQHWSKINQGDANQSMMKAEYLEVYDTLA